MSSPEETPVWKTGALWGVLAVLLVVGTVASAFVVYGITQLAGGGSSLVAAFAIATGGIVAFLAFLFMAGILYRVDRYRGKNARRVELFE